MPLFKLTPSTALNSDSGVTYSAAPPRFPGHVVLKAGERSILLTPAQWALIKKTLVVIPGVRPQGA
jgi:hypothetical protein